MPKKNFMIHILIITVILFFENQIFSKEKKLEIIHIKGSWSEMGYQYGKKLDKQINNQFEKIKNYVSNHYHFKNEEIELFIKNKTNLYLEGNKAILSGHFGDMIQGISRATHFPIWKIVAISYPFDLAVDVNQGFLPNCSFVAIQSDRHVISGRNMDWIQSMKPDLENILVTIYEPTEDNPNQNRVYTIGHIGLLGAITGGNSRGLFAELNSGHLSTGDIMNPDLIPYPFNLLEMLIQSNNLFELKEKVTDWKRYQPEEAFTVGIVGFDPEQSKNSMLAIEIASGVKKELESAEQNLFYQIRSAESQTIFENDNGANAHPGVLVSTNVFRMPGWGSRLPEKNPVTQQNVVPYRGMEDYPSGDPNDFCMNEYGVKCCAEQTINSCFNAPPPTKSMSFFRYNNLLALGKANRDITITKMKGILDAPLSLEAGGGSTESSGMPDFIKNYNNDFTYYQTIYDTEYPKKIWLKIPNTSENKTNDSPWVELNLEKYGL